MLVPLLLKLLVLLQCLNCYILRDGASLDRMIRPYQFGQMSDLILRLRQLLLVLRDMPISLHLLLERVLSWSAGNGDW